MKLFKPTVIAKADTTEYSTNDVEYTFVFNDPLTKDLPAKIISVNDPEESPCSDTLTIYKTGQPIKKLDIRFQGRSSSKLEALKFNRFVAVGVSGYFYLYDLSSDLIVLFIYSYGYFDEFKIHDQHLFVTYNSGMYCLTKYGIIKWHNSDVGIDGVYITEFKENKIYGREQIDPPDGWRDFILEFETGNRIQ